MGESGRRRAALVICLTLAAAIIGISDSVAATHDQLSDEGDVGTAGAQCPPVVNPVSSPHPNGTYDAFYGVAAVSTRDAWAVGRTDLPGLGGRALAQHWDGQSWKGFPNPPNLPYTALYGVAALATDDVWAVGESGGTSTGVYVQHWDGEVWRVIATPALSWEAGLTAISGASPNDVWAVGWQMPDRKTYQTNTLIEHWDGSAWAIVPSPDPPSWTHASLSGIHARSQNDVWAVGSNLQPEKAALIKHWDGTTWSISLSSGGVSYTSVSARVANDAWAVGRTVDWTSSAISHWDGTSWTTTTYPAPANAFSTSLRSVVALASGDVWVAGTNEVSVYRYTRRTFSFIANYDGNEWTHVSVVDSTVLSGLAAPSAAYLWAVGYSAPDISVFPGTLPPIVTRVSRICPMAVTPAGFKPNAARASQGDMVSWYVAQDARAHTITDASGLGLFDSGWRQPGQAFNHAFVAAGTYPIIDWATQRTAQVTVPTVVTPVTGTSSTVFTIKWAVNDLPFGTAADVEIAYCSSGQASCEQRFKPWKTGSQELQSTFGSVDFGWHGAGAYYFRARLRGASGKTGWSPSAQITVS